MKLSDGWTTVGAATVATALIAFAVAFYQPSELSEDIVPKIIVPVLEEVEDSVSIIFVGDIMLDRGVARHAMREGEKSLVSDEIRKLFATVDLRVGNLEGTITASSSIALIDPSILRFTFSPKLTETFLGDLNFSAVSSANNHGLDFGADGLVETKENLKSWNIGTFGDPLNSSDELAAFDVGGKSVCLFGYHDLFVQNPEKVLALLQNMEPNCWRSVLVTHWGEEYQATTTERQRILARQFIDSGADLVIGAHPHVVQPFETYRGVPIFYSLGNFMFDQDFSWGTTHGVVVIVEFDDKGTKVTPIALASHQAETSLATEEAKERVLGELRKEFGSGLVITRETDTIYRP